MARTMTAAGRAALKAREGERLVAYRDTVGVPTIGVGHTGRAGPPPVHMGMTITKAQSDAIFAADLAPFERAVEAADPHGRLSDNAFDASVSLAFNIGAPGFSGSTVARRIAEGDMAGAADAILMWSKPPELALRRRAERAQFLTPDAPRSPTPVLDRLERTIASDAAAGIGTPAPPLPSPGAVNVERPAPSWWKRMLGMKD